MRFKSIKCSELLSRLYSCMLIFFKLCTCVCVCICVYTCLNVCKYILIEFWDGLRKKHFLLQFIEKKQKYFFYTRELSREFLKDEMQRTDKHFINGSTLSIKGNQNCFYDFLLSRHNGQKEMMATDAGTNVGKQEDFFTADGSTNQCSYYVNQWKESKTWEWIYPLVQLYLS